VPEQAAETLYTRARGQGNKGLLSVILGGSNGLLSLKEIASGTTFRVCQANGTRRVPIRQIQGSECRPGDFDRDFHPLHDLNKARWLGVADAQLRGKTLAPVALTEVGDVYFVRDGHHRISVARALGQTTVEATVEVWHVDRPLSCDEQTNQPRRIKRLLRGLTRYPRPAQV
jgi:hypothetical protein